MRINVRTNTGAARSCEVVVTAGSETASVTVSQAASGDQPEPGNLGEYVYSVGLISDIHFHTLESAGNRVLATKSEGNSNNDDAGSYFKEDFKKLITVFE